MMNDVEEVLGFDDDDDEDFDVASSSVVPEDKPKESLRSVTLDSILSEDMLNEIMGEESEDEYDTDDDDDDDSTADGAEESSGETKSTFARIPERLKSFGFDLVYLEPDEPSQSETEQTFHWIGSRPVYKQLSNIVRDRAKSSIDLFDLIRADSKLIAIKICDTTLVGVQSTEQEDTSRLFSMYASNSAVAVGNSNNIFGYIRGNVMDNIDTYRCMTDEQILNDLKQRAGSPLKDEILHNIRQKVAILEIINSVKRASLSRRSVKKKSDGEFLPMYKDMENLIRLVNDKAAFDNIQQNVIVVGQFEQISDTDIITRNVKVDGKYLRVNDLFMFMSCGNKSFVTIMPKIVNGRVLVLHPILLDVLTERYIRIVSQIYPNIGMTNSKDEKLCFRIDEDDVTKMLEGLVVQNIGASDVHSVKRHTQRYMPFKSLQIDKRYIMDLYGSVISRDSEVNLFEAAILAETLAQDTAMNMLINGVAKSPRGVESDALEILMGNDLFRDLLGSVECSNHATVHLETLFKLLSAEDSTGSSIFYKHLGAILTAKYQGVMSKYNPYLLGYLGVANHLQQQFDKDPISACQKVTSSGDKDRLKDKSELGVHMVTHMVKAFGNLQGSGLATVEDIYNKLVSDGNSTALASFVLVSCVATFLPDVSNLWQYNGNERYGWDKTLKPSQLFRAFNAKDDLSAAASDYKTYLGTHDYTRSECSIDAIFRCNINSDTKMPEDLEQFEQNIQVYFPGVAILGMAEYLLNGNMSAIPNSDFYLKAVNAALGGA